MFDLARQRVFSSICTYLWSKAEIQMLELNLSSLITLSPLIQLEKRSKSADLCQASHWLLYDQSPLAFHIWKIKGQSLSIIGKITKNSHHYQHFFKNSNQFIALRVILPIKKNTGCHQKPTKGTFFCYDKHAMTHSTLSKYEIPRK